MEVIIKPGIATFVGDAIEVDTSEPARFNTAIHATGISSFANIKATNLTVAEDI